MKVSEFLGKRVLDKKAVEIGKVSDIDVDAILGAVGTITISSGDFSLSKNEFEIKNQDIDQVGDYVLLKIEKAELEIRSESAQNSEKKKLKLK
ncbi:MAG TPA: PRC-barrel domain-containing protein [Methanobacteriaceae archaeon]|nr:PRC-barrel domain-containing protein [Methanobacteriaceae archaeon]